MCPMCWATFLASFGGIVVVSVLLVAGSDKWTLFLSGILGVVSAWQRWGDQPTPWWCVVALSAAIVMRLAYVVCKHRERVLIFTAWRRARAIAAQRCPTK
jgi:hypothetical protein